MSEQPSSRSFRWQALLQRSSEALFVLDRRRRLLYVNPAWETLTSCSLDRARGLLCRKLRPNSTDNSQEEILAHMLTPPPEAIRGEFSRVRRLFHNRSIPTTYPQWWDIEFFPLRQSAPHQGSLLIGRIQPRNSVDRAEEPILPERLESLRLNHCGRFSFEMLSSVHSAMLRVAQQARLASIVNVPLLIVGGRGTGKKTLARIVHHAGPNRERAIAILDCQRTPTRLLVELLCSERSLRRSTSIGTLYLSNPSYLPREVQLHLCEWLAEQFEGRSPRLTFGCHQEPLAEVKAGRLIEEFSWRMSTQRIDLPQLKERPRDMESLVQRLFSEMGTGVRVSADVLEALVAYSWPGNLSELREVLCSAISNSVEKRIDLEHLPRRIRDALFLEQHPAVPGVRAINLEVVLQQVERNLIRHVLERVRGNRTRAAELLGLHRSRLLRRLDALGIEHSSDEDS